MTHKPHGLGKWRRPRMTWYHCLSDILTLRIYVQPGSKRNEVVGLYQNELKIKLQSPAIEGRANVALVKYLAQLFDVPRSSVVLKSGETSRHKVVSIHATVINPESILS